MAPARTFGAPVGNATYGRDGGSFQNPGDPAQGGPNYVGPRTPGMGGMGGYGHAGMSFAGGGGGLMPPSGGGQMMIQGGAPAFQNLGAGGMGGTEQGGMSNVQSLLARTPWGISPWTGNTQMTGRDNSSFREGGSSDGGNYGMWGAGFNFLKNHPLAAMLFGGGPMGIGQLQAMGVPGLGPRQPAAPMGPSGVGRQSIPMQSLEGGQGGNSDILSALLQGIGPMPGNFYGRMRGR